MGKRRVGVEITNGKNHSTIGSAVQLLKERLDGRRLIVISNREPYVHKKVRGEVHWERPAGGVTSVLDPLMQSANGVWVAWGSGDSDRKTVDNHDRIRVPPDNPQYTLRRVWLSSEEVKQYYHGYSNRFLWPLCHMALDRVVLQQTFWEGYRRVNERFAVSALEELKDQKGVVWVHDYHLMLCPLLLKQKRPDLQVAIFWHIPWPADDVFRICPQRKELLLSLLSCDQIGFHLDRYRENFLECVKRELGAKVEPGGGGVVYGNRRTTVSVFPVSIDFGHFEQLARSPGTVRRISNIHKRLNIGPKTIVGLGVDRLDYSKGLLKRLWALREFLTRYPDFHRRFIFIQVSAPTRAENEPYQRYRDILHAEVRDINEQFGKPGWKPIEYIEGQLNHDALAAYYRRADFCLVSSVYDGMNLVSKEYVASQVDEPGVLVLSEMAGSLEELDGALPINPYDLEATARTLQDAMAMTAEEKRIRMTQMRSYLQKHDIYRWMENNLEAITRTLG